MASTNTLIPHVNVIWMAFLLFFGSLQPCLCFSGNSSESGSCIEREMKALLSIQKGIYDAHKWLSWNGKDCCRWRGVRCDPMTGHVVKLDLRYPYPYDVEYLYDKSFLNKSEVSPSLLHLRHLNYLDLSMNNFSGAPIPDFIGSLANLEYLNLSNAEFGGTIPHQLGNLSNLLYLDLASSFWHSLDVDNLGWLAQIRSLQHLDMSHANLSKASNWIHVINMLPSLSVLRLFDAALSSLPSTLPFVNFTSLTTLDISYNNFSSSIPGWLFNVSSLEHLNLRDDNFHGNIPLAIGNLKKLRDLDLSSNNFSGDIPETMWSLKSLRSIYLSWNNFNGSIPETVGNLNSLESLELGRNNINGEIPKTIGSLTKLHSLDLSGNDINGQIPETVGNLCNLSYFGASRNNINGDITGFMEGFSRCSTNRLQYIYLYGNNLSGALPSQIGELQSLEYLDLNDNLLNGSIPASLGKLSALFRLDLSSNFLSSALTEAHFANLASLSSLDLSDNLLNGSIPASLGKLSALFRLDLSSNSLSGALTEAHFANLTSLSSLDLSHNSLTVNVSQNWLPPFKAKDISMRSCPLGPKFPSWLQSQTALYSLDLSNTGISENFPNWFGDMYQPIHHLNVSHNHMKGKLPTPTEKRKGKLLGSRNLLSFITYRVLSRDAAVIVEGYIDLSNNLFSGPIPSAFCEANDLAVLDLANNDLSGVIPDCWNNSLQVIDFSYNRLSGGIPSSMGSLSQLNSLHLGNNNLSGKIPLSLQQCKQLITLDLGNNKLSGTIPEWIGNLSTLEILRLRSNILDGNIPMQLSLLASLQVLDLADNKLSGTLPPSFGNFKAMIVIQNGGKPILSGYVASYYTENLLMTMKSKEFTLITIVLSLVTSIDLSNNNISGEIPKEFTNLHGLYSLNLSGNHLTGMIPKNIGAMGQLESLDLSMNNLSSTIPTSISNLTSLEYLNLSHNNLSGRFPNGYQLQTLINDPSIYIGNQYLCGLPLLEKCPGDEPAEGATAHGREEKQDGNDSEMIWFYVSLSPGFVIGFWAFLGAMMLKRSTRYAYIQFIDRICDWIYMAVTINSARPKSKRNRRPM